MNSIRDFRVRTVGRRAQVSGSAAYNPLPPGLPASAFTFEPLLFELHLHTSDLATLAHMLDKPDRWRTVLPCDGIVRDGDHDVPVIAVRSRYSTLTPPNVDQHTGNVWLEYIADTPRPHDLDLREVYAATFLDITRAEADRIAGLLLEAIPALALAEQ